jgi:cytochrome P450
MTGTAPSTGFEADAPFGGGDHFCIGAPFARMEMEVALPRLLARFGRLEWASRPRWKDSLRLHGPERLDIWCRAD